MCGGNDQINSQKQVKKQIEVKDRKVSNKIQDKLSIFENKSVSEKKTIEDNLNKEKPENNITVENKPVKKKVGLVKQNSDFVRTSPAYNKINVNAPKVRANAGNTMYKTISDAAFKECLIKFGQGYEDKQMAYKQTGMRLDQKRKKESYTRGKENVGKVKDFLFDQMKIGVGNAVVSAPLVCSVLVI